MTKKLIKISKYRPSIFQGAFDFGDAREVSLALEHPLEALSRRILIALLVLMACGYLYFVTASVLNVIARKEAISNVASIRGEIGGLEQKYFGLTEGITQLRGASLGLAPVTNTQYVNRQGNVGAATIHSDAI